MKHTLILAAASVACCTVALAQNSVNGQIDANAGLGTAMPYGGSVKLDIKGQKWTFQPMIGVEGVGKNASTELEDLHYYYTNNLKAPTDKQSNLGFLYDSESNLESKGYNLKYGMGVLYNLDASNIFNVTLAGNHRDVDVSGTRLEVLRTGSQSSTSVNSRLCWPGKKQDAVNLNAGFTHKTQRPGESIQLQYVFGYQHLDENMTQEVLSGQTNNFTKFQTSALTTDATTQKHTVSLDWKRPLTSNQALSAGLRYDRIALSSYDEQQFDQKPAVSEDFEHNTRTGAAYIAYNAHFGQLTASARLEYDYTHQQDTVLHDWIPVVNLRWQASAHDALTAAYVRRVIRPTLEYLNPFNVCGAFTQDRGTSDLIGIHFNNVMLAYNHKQETVDFTTTLSHIFVEDGFNAIWMATGTGNRISFWGNAGVRRAWSLTPDVKWTLSPLTTVKASVQVLWDKRIAYAINMAKEHWGVTARAELQQVLPKSFLLNLKAGYSEGNTVDLYSHEGNSFDLGAQLKHTFLRCPRLSAGLSYDYRKHPHLVLTQGAYTGDVYRRSGDRYAASAQLTYKF